MSVVDILKYAFQLYFTHGLAFTRTLFMSLGLLFIGLYIALWGSISFMNYMEENYRPLEPVVVASGVFGFLAIGIYLHVRGFWAYLVYIVSLNINTQEALEKRPIDFKGAYQAITRKANPYVLVLLAITIVWFFPTIYGIVTPALIESAFAPTDPLYWVLSLLNLFISFVLTVIGAVVSVYLSMVFQVVAFETVTLNPIPTLKRSWALIKGNFWRATGLLIIIGIITNLIAPTVVTVLLELTHITASVSEAIMKTVAEALVRTFFTEEAKAEIQHLFNAPEIQQILISAQATDLVGILLDPALYINIISQGLTIGLFQSLTVSLLLPLGTFTWTLLYQDLCARHTPRLSPNDEKIEQTLAAEMN